MGSRAARGAQALVFLGTTFILGCSIGEEGLTVDSEQSSTGDASRAGLESFLASLAGNYVPLYTSDGQYSGRTAYLHEDGRFKTCNTHMYESLGSCLQSKDRKSDYVELGFVPAHQEGTCVGGENMMSAMLGHVTAESICVYSGDTPLEPINGLKNEAAREGYWHDFVLPRGTPVLTTELTIDGKLTRTHLMFSPQGYAASAPESAPTPDISGDIVNTGSTAQISTKGKQLCPSTNFTEFVNEFKQDASVQKSFTATTVSYTSLDANFNDVVQTKRGDEFSFPIFPFGGDGDSEIFIEFAADADYASVLERGIDNGIMVTFGFKRQDSCWQLASIEDLST